MTILRSYDPAASASDSHLVSMCRGCGPHSNFGSFMSSLCFHCPPSAEDFILSPPVCHHHLLIHVLVNPSHTPQTAIAFTLRDRSSFCHSPVQNPSAASHCPSHSLIGHCVLSIRWSPTRAFPSSP